MSSRRRRWLFGTVLALGVLGIALGIARYVILPRIVRSQVVAALARLGVTNVSFDVQHASLWSTALQDVQGDGDSLHVRGVEVTYSPLDAMRGKLDSIVLTGARLKIDLDRPPGGVDSTPEATGSFDLPFERLDLKSCAIVLKRLAHELEIPVDGSLVGNDSGRADLKVVSSLSGAPLNVTGTIDPASGRIDIAADAADVQAAAVRDLLPVDWTRAISRAGGTLAASARFIHSDARNHATLHIALDDVWLETPPDIGIVARGIDAAVTFDDLLALTTPSRQWIDIAAFTVEEQQLTDAVVSLQLAGRDALHVEHLQFNWGGGEVRADPFVFDASDPTIDTTVIVQHVGLKEVIALISQGRATGTGAVSGAVPIRLAWVPRDGKREIRVDFGEGSLRADAPGNLRIGDASQNFGEMLEQSNPAFATDPELRQMRDDVLDAVQNFDYRLLEVRFHKIDGEDAVLIRIHGRGNTGRRVPINLNFSVTGIDAGLRAYLRTWSRVLSDVMRKAER